MDLKECKIEDPLVIKARSRFLGPTSPIMKSKDKEQPRSGYICKDPFQNCLNLNNFNRC